MYKLLLALLFVLSFGFGSVSPVVAAVPSLYTADNFLSSEHDMPKSFWSDGAGGFGGITMSGKSFRQQPIVADIHIRLQRFQIEEATFYISNLGLIMAQSDTEALSIYLSRANWSEETVG